MPDISNIDSQKLLAAADKLDQTVSRMHVCVGSFADAIEALDKGWISEVKAAFMSNYQVDWEAMQEMLSQLGEFNSCLREAAVDFDKTDTEIGTEVGTLG